LLITCCHRKCHNFCREHNDLYFFLTALKQSISVHLSLPVNSNYAEWIGEKGSNTWTSRISHVGLNPVKLAANAGNEAVSSSVATRA
jgi:hypothetical protein